MRRIETAEAIGIRIKQFRAMMSITQSELGAIVGISQDAISQWETGKRSPSIEMLLLMADIFQVEIYDFLSDYSISSNSSADT